MKLLNELDDIYNEGLFYEDGKIICSVCDKKYSREKSALNHFNSRICHSYSDIFKDTITEETLLNIYLNVMSVHNVKNDNKGGRITKNYFRKSRYYNTVAKFYMFCYINSIRNQIDYLQFLFEKISFNNVFQVLNVGIKESALIDYMAKRRKDRSDNACELFFNVNEELLKNNTTFAIRSLERGDIRYDYLFKKIEIDSFFNKLSNAEANNLEKFLKNV